MQDPCTKFHIPKSVCDFFTEPRRLQELNTWLQTSDSEVEAIFGSFKGGLPDSLFESGVSKREFLTLQTSDILKKFDLTEINVISEQNGEYRRVIDIKTNKIIRIERKIKYVNRAHNLPRLGLSFRKSEEIPDVWPDGLEVKSIRKKYRKSYSNDGLFKNFHIDTTSTVTTSQNKPGQAPFTQRANEVELELKTGNSSTIADFMQAILVLIAIMQSKSQYITDNMLKPGYLLETSDLLRFILPDSVKRNIKYKMNSSLYLYKRVSSLQVEDTFARPRDVQLWDLMNPRIVQNSYVTAKLDGVRYYLVIVDGRLFLVNPPLEIQLIGHYKQNSYNNSITIMDCEFYTGLLNGQKVKRLYIFDLLVLKNDTLIGRIPENLLAAKFGGKNKSFNRADLLPSPTDYDANFRTSFQARYEKLYEIHTDLIENCEILDNVQLKLKIYYPNPLQSKTNKIFKFAEETFNIMDDTGLENDGIIVQPADTDYRWTVRGAFSPVNYKWKYPDQLAADFLVRSTSKKDYFELLVQQKGDLIPFTGNKINTFNKTVYFENGQFTDEHNQTTKVDEEIIEFVWDYCKENFKPIRWRRDKNRPNGIDTVRNIWKLMNDPLGQKTFSGKTLEIFRKFIHKQVKIPLYEQAIPDSSTILELGSGRAADYHKWLGKGFTVYSVEPDKELINEGLARIQSTGQYEDRFKFLQSIAQDTQSIVSWLSKSKTPKVDAVVSMISSTFFFGSKNDFMNVMKTIDEVVKVGGIFMGIMIDGVKMQELVEKKGKNNELDNSVINIKLNKNKWKSSNFPFGRENFVHLKDDDVLPKNQIEWLTDFDYMANILQELGFVIRNTHFLPDRPYNMSQENSSGEFVQTKTHIQDFLNNESMDWASTHRVFVFERKSEKTNDNIFKSVSNISFSPMKNEKQTKNEIFPNPSNKNVLISGKMQSSNSKLEKDEFENLDSECFSIFDPDIPSTNYLMEEGAKEKMNPTSFSHLDLFVLGEIGDGSCLFHSILDALTLEYRKLSTKEKRDYVRRFRRGLSKKLNKKVLEEIGSWDALKSDYIQNNVIPRVKRRITSLSKKDWFALLKKTDLLSDFVLRKYQEKVYDSAGDESWRNTISTENIKQLHIIGTTNKDLSLFFDYEKHPVLLFPDLGFDQDTINEKIVTELQGLFDSQEFGDDRMLKFIEYSLDINILFLQASDGMPLHRGYDEERLVTHMTIVVHYIDQLHFQLIVRKKSNGEFRSLFPVDDPLITSIISCV